MPSSDTQFKKGIHPVTEFKKRHILTKNEKHPFWKENRVGYRALHTWIRKNKQKIDFCQECKINKPFDLANISGNYLRDINDFEWLCRRCHMLKDGRIKN